MTIQPNGHSPRHHTRAATARRRPTRKALACSAVAVALIASACGSSSTTGSSGGSTSSTASSSASSTTRDSTGSSADLTTEFKQAKWAKGVTVTYADGKLRFVSNGIPDHQRDAEYAVPKGGVQAPTANTAVATADPTVAQSYDVSIPLSPSKAASTTSTSLGIIGYMISGAALFNPYEGDGTTVATASNFSVKNASGQDVWFLDDCAGHPTPMGQYHYHALPKCVTASVDTTDGPSHIIGIALDGYPIYGNRDASGDAVKAADLDECNGITSATPEFPNGTYHYVLLDTADSTSSIRCFAGVVDAALASSQGMPGMGGGPGRPGGQAGPPPGQ